MTPEAQSWWKTQLSLSLVIQLVIAAGTGVACFTSFKVAVADQERRLSYVESHYVPREQHDATDHLRDQKDRLNDERLQHIERDIDQIYSLLVKR